MGNESSYLDSRSDTKSLRLAAGGSAWRPAPVIQFGLGNQYLGATTIQLTFAALGSTWQLDDLYIDPLKHI